MGFLVPGQVVGGCAQPERAAQVDHARPGIQHGGRQIHGNFRGRGQEYYRKAFRMNDLWIAGEALRRLRAADRRGWTGFLAMLQQVWLNPRVPRQNANQLRAAVSSITDNADLSFHVVVYSL